MIIPIAGLVAGILLGYYFLPYEIPLGTTTYVAVSILVCIDSILGGIKSYLCKMFSASIFLSGVVGDIIIALFLTYIGMRLGLDLYMVAVIVVGMRIFNNFAVIRRILIKNGVK